MRNLLRSLHGELATEGTAALTQAVKGLGGVGKTQLALEYAYRYASDYDAVAWFRAEDPMMLGSDHAALAEFLGLEIQPDQAALSRAAALDVARLTGCLPLALEQAAAYIETRGQTLRNLCRNLR